MKKIILLNFLFFSFINGFCQVQVDGLLCENRINPVGIDTEIPQFSWRLSSGLRNVMQVAYEIKVGNFLAGIKNKKLLWESGKILSGQSVHVTYSGTPLESGRKYFWQVRVWDNKGKVSAWSQPSFFEMGFLHTKDWQAKWIEPGFVGDTVGAPCPIFRKEFTINKKIITATAFITSHGIYEAQINGRRIGNDYLTPGWTSYNKRLQYQVFEVTDLLKSGENAIGVTVGSGWYRSALAYEHNINYYGNSTGLLFQLKLSYDDGSSKIITSDASWKCSTGPIRYSEIYNGETIDSRLEKNGWTSAGYDDSGWNSVKVAEYSFDNLIATSNEPIKKQEIFKPVKIFTTSKGEKVIDFGQNLVGWVKINVKGKTGDTVTLSHAEVLDKEGNFYTENLRSAKAQNNYILKGGAEETFEPHFTWQGFRYVRVEGYPGELQPSDFIAVALYSDMKQTGTFTCSNELINQLQHNITWGQKGNFLDVPTDCPQRDERLGWTGDAQAFSRTAAFNMHVNNFFSKWLQDLEADQSTDGSVPFVVPNVLANTLAGSAGWADAATIVPWNIYLAYGDSRILKQQYGSMKAWVDYVRSKSQENLWKTGYHFGDWLFYRPGDDTDGRAAVTDKYLIAQCFYAHSTQLLINAANVLGNTNDAEMYTELLNKIKNAFVQEYMTANGRLVSGTQTAYVLALNFDMMPEGLRAQSAKRLVENIRSYNNHLTTGFLGTPYLNEVLTRFGYNDIAYSLLLQDTHPSWLYPVKMGATTIWERWDGERPDGTFQTPDMNSFNHYAYGAIGDWMYRRIVGIDIYADGVGYKHIKIQPHIESGITFASASLETYYGKISNSWKVEGDSLIMEVQIPVNTTATVFVPASNIDEVKECSQLLSNKKDIKVLGMEGEFAKLELGSGSYHISSSNPVKRPPE